MRNAITPRRPFGYVAFVTSSAILLLGQVAQAEPGTIESPKRHTPYRVELEPHALLGFGYLEDGAFGLGMRATVILSDPGFVTSINDTVGISFGADLFLGRRSSQAVYVPVQLQWNFFFTKHWSMMAEPGVGFAFFGERTRLWPALSIGGRYHFADRIALTFRVGYPALSVGLSFLL
jgi:hypothetical protein